MTFAEALPAQCPPNDATDVSYEVVYRLIAQGEVGPDCFKSQHALGILNDRGVNPCVWASCSLVMDAEAQIRRWPRMRMSKAYAAKLSIPVGAGASKRKKDANHVNFWRYSSFDFNSVVVEIVELPEIDFDV